VRHSFAVIAAMLLPSLHASPALAATVPGPIWSGYVASGATFSDVWSGYVASGATFSDVRGSWTHPAVVCPTGQRQLSSFWVGLDGFTSSSVEQVGTAAACDGSGHAIHWAWYEMFPSPSVRVNIAVRPGDRLAARVTASDGIFTLAIQNDTTGQSFATRQTSSTAEQSSAEWIAENPLICGPASCLQPRLTNFGTVSFTGSFTVGDDESGSISGSGWSSDRLVMQSGSGVVKAQPSSLSSAGTAFSVTWQHS